VNGFIFQNRDIVGLAGMLKLLLSNAEVRNRIGESAAETMQRLWHPRVGAERLIALWNGLLGDAPMPNYSEGPCSRCFVGL
jgi:glycosyltransferase involved in cell wall biosynthesis